MSYRVAIRDVASDHLTLDYTWDAMLITIRDRNGTVRVQATRALANDLGDLLGWWAEGTADESIPPARNTYTLVPRVFHTDLDETHIRCLPVLDSDGVQQKYVNLPLLHLQFDSSTVWITPAQAREVADTLKEWSAGL